MGRGGKVAGERSDDDGGNGATMSGARPSADTTDVSKLVKKGRQQLNEEVEALLDMQTVFEPYYK